MGKVEEWGAEQEKHEKDHVEAMLAAAKDGALNEKGGSLPPNGKAGPMLNGGATVSTDAAREGPNKANGVALQDYAEGAAQANRISSNGSSTLNGRASAAGETERVDMAPDGVGRNRTVTISELANGSGRGSAGKRGRRRGMTRSDMRPFCATEEILLEKHDAEELLKRVQGTLVLFPYDW